MDNVKTTGFLGDFQTTCAEGCALTNIVFLPVFLFDLKVPIADYRTTKEGPKVIVRYLNKKLLYQLFVSSIYQWSAHDVTPCSFLFSLGLQPLLPIRKDMGCEEDFAIGRRERQFAGQITRL